MQVIRSNHFYRICCRIWCKSRADGKTLFRRCKGTFGKMLLQSGGNSRIFALLPIFHALRTAGILIFHHKWGWVGHDLIFVNGKAITMQIWIFQYHIYIYTYMNCKLWSNSGAMKFTYIHRFPLSRLVYNLGDQVFRFHESFNSIDCSSWLSVTEHQIAFVFR